MRREEPRAQSRIPEYDPAGGSWRARVAVRPRTDEIRIEVEHLVLPAFRDCGHARMNGVGLEDKQLPGVRALLQRLHAELCGTGLDNRDRPRRMAVRPIGVRDEGRMQCLDARQCPRSKVNRRLIFCVHTRILPPSAARGYLRRKQAREASGAWSRYPAEVSIRAVE